uniref:Uncharacterized protein n=1 Tax=Arundo donax TaxID=35708 RepID=A0A0A9FSN4_ARUDO
MPLSYTMDISHVNIHIQRQLQSSEYPKKAFRDIFFDRNCTPSLKVYSAEPFRKEILFFKPNIG